MTYLIQEMVATLEAIVLIMKLIMVLKGMLIVNTRNNFILVSKKNFFYEIWHTQSSSLQK